MSTGIWTLKCGACGEPFTLVLADATPLMPYLKAHRCPACGQIPTDFVLTWHSIEDFKLRVEDD